MSTTNISVSFICRVLKPGGLASLHEVAMTDNYDSSNPAHKKIMEDLMVKLHLIFLTNINIIMAQTITHQHQNDERGDFIDHD